MMGKRNRLADQNLAIDRKAYGHQTATPYNKFNQVSERQTNMEV